MGNSLALQNGSDPAADNAGIGSSTSGGTNSVPNSRFNLLYSHFYFSPIQKRKKPAHQQTVSFSSHFIIAGRRFKNLINQTQNFLFGDQLDLNFILAHKPVAFPYGTPLIEQPSQYLQSLVNIRKDTIRLIKVISEDSQPGDPIKYNLEFRFDCDCDVRVKVYYFAHEKFVMTNDTIESAHGLQHVNLRQLSYVCGCSNYMRSVANKASSKAECFCLNDPEGNVYSKGANVLFQNQRHVIVPAQFDAKAWQFKTSTNYYPVVIECTPVNEQVALRHAHSTLAYIEKIQTLPSTSSITPLSHQSSIPTESHSKKSLTTSSSIPSSQSSDSTSTAPAHSYQLKPIKQKQLIDGVLYSLQEIYGIEKKISPDGELSQAASVSNSNTSNSIATQNSNLSASKSSNLNVESGAEIVKEPYSNDISAMDKQRQMEQEIEQEMKGIECVICMCETRDTLILPCRHLCLCKLCAINLRVQSNNCPICRIPFIALIQLKLVKKKESPQICTNPEKNLPIVRMENLPIVKLSGMMMNQINTSLDVSHDNVIIEEKPNVTAVESRSDNDLLCKKAFERRNYLDIFETVTIYDAFNNSNQENQSAADTFKMSSYRQKKLKMMEQTKIKNNSDFVRSVNEVGAQMNRTVSENTIPKLFEIQNISNQIDSYGIKARLENDLRCSSVVLNKTLSESTDKMYRSSSFIGNLRQLNKLNESIQMEEVPNLNATSNM